MVDRKTRGVFRWLIGSQTRLLAKLNFPFSAIAREPCFGPCFLVAGCSEIVHYLLIALWLHCIAMDSELGRVKTKYTQEYEPK